MSTRPAPTPAATTPARSSPKAPPAPAAAASAEPGAGRVVSIDALRGFDMFWIVGGHGLILALAGLVWKLLPEWLTAQMKHAQWEGFTAWDMIMPLFLFIVGTAMPFSFARRFDQGASKLSLHRKILVRVLILWVLGMIAQGHLLDFQLDKLHLYSNTLQAIAAGYLVAGLVLVNLPGWIHLPITAGLLAGYWALMTYVPVPGYAAGMLQEQVNLGRYVDDLVLGSFRDGSTYTWIIGSLNFAAMVMLGLHAGQILRWRRSGWTKTAWLVLAGAACLGAGWAWSYRLPLNKHLFSSSMVLWAAGWSYLLLAGFYLVIDVIGWRRWAFSFVVIGANAIFAYMITHVFSFGELANKLVFGLAQHVGPAAPALRAFTAVLLLWLILYYLYRNKTFVRV